MYQGCRAARFGFSEVDFCEMVAAVTTRALGEKCSEGERERFLRSLHLEELVLVRACARGNDSAWEEFVHLYREKLYGTALSIAQESVEARELADSTFAELFGLRVRQDGSRNSKFEYYSGRGSLEGWLRTLVAQEWVNRLRKRRRLTTLDLAIGVQGRDGEIQPGPFSRELNEGTEWALAGLSAEERLMLTAYYFDGRSLAEVGRMLNVHESTVSRRLEKTTTNLRKRIIGYLRLAGLSREAAEELLESDVRDITVNVRRRLGQESKA